MRIIEGFATADATGTHAKRFDALSYSTMGRTGLYCSQAGFGCYRIADGIDAHRNALRQALDGGINLIDTSANYADGESETLVGKVLTDAIESGTLNRAAIIVVTKGGYLQGRNYALSQERKAKGQPFPDLVPYADGLEHCIHPEFLEDQVTRSLERLNLATLDFFLLHNPEYYLSWAAAKQGMEQGAANTAYEGRILNAFQHLEREVARGRIRYYGISSNTFPEPSDRPDFTCLQRILDVAKAVGPEHHFAVIQFPMNLLESGAVLNRNQPDGATLFTTAIKAGLGTLVNRPLNAHRRRWSPETIRCEIAPPLFPRRDRSGHSGAGELRECLGPRNVAPSGPIGSITHPHRNPDPDRFHAVAAASRFPVL